MKIQTLKSLAKFKGIRQADIASMAGVSRQAVNKWWSSGEQDLNVLSKNQERLAEFFNVPMGALSVDMPIVSNESERTKLETQLLWDKSYPDLECFARGLVLGHHDALARLAQVFGLFAAEKIAGQQIWKKFPKYKNKIHPGRRRTLEVIWNDFQHLI